ncbi:MAG: hypothetical protein LBT76_04395, partial [Tannerella sp.]|nr:hypothetical protein [Tannerella sp.]
KILFRIEITGEGKTEALAREYAESVSIDFSQSGDRVSAETVLPNIRCSGDCGRTTHYVVVAPKNVAADLENKYGNIQLDRLLQPLKVDLKYGNLQAGSLGGATIDIKYGNVTVQSCESLELDSKYSGITLGTVGTLKADSKYDKFRIESVVDVRLNTAYTDVKADRLLKSFVAGDFKYCSLTVSEVAVDFSRIKIDAAYTNVQIAFNDRHSFNAVLFTRYGKIRVDKLAPLVFSGSSEAKNNQVSYIGRFGQDSQPSASVDISISYGNITF